MKRFVIFFLTAIIASCQSNTIDNKAFQEGDILFQDLDCGAACDAIELVTEGVDGYDFSHCGIVANVDGKLQVVEAYGAVRATPIDSFLNRSFDEDSKPKVLIGRPKDQALAHRSATLSKDYIGSPYDDAFVLDDNAYYCSELVYECFKKANDNNAYFPLNLMTFKEPGTDSIMPFWKEYYKDLGLPVPEGEKGINPGAISRSDKLDIIRLP